MLILGGKDAMRMHQGHSQHLEPTGPYETTSSADCHWSSDDRATRSRPFAMPIAIARPNREKKIAASCTLMPVMEFRNFSIDDARSQSNIYDLSIEAHLRSTTSDQSTDMDFASSPLSMSSTSIVDLPGTDLRTASDVATGLAAPSNHKQVIPSSAVAFRSFSSPRDNVLHISLDEDTAKAPLTAQNSLQGIAASQDALLPSKAVHSDQVSLASCEVASQSSLSGQGLFLERNSKLDETFACMKTSSRSGTSIYNFFFKRKICSYVLSTLQGNVYAINFLNSNVILFFTLTQIWS
jgi:hypothetical protein